MTWLLNLIPGFSFLRLAIASVIVVALSAGVWKIRHDGVVVGRLEVQTKWDADRSQLAAQSYRLAEKMTRDTVDLQAKADRAIEVKNDKIRALNTAVASVLASLHDRPDRPAAGSTPDAATAQSSCTGASLYRPDAEFLIREAGRADVIRLDLLQCQSAYAAAQSTLR